MCVVEPVPVTVIVQVPAVAVDAALTVIVAEPPEVTEDGLNETETPLGAPEAERLTVWALPLVVVVLTVAVVEAPGARLPEVGLTDTEKSLVGVPPTASCQIAYAMPSAVQDGRVDVAGGGGGGVAGPVLMFSPP